MKSRTKRMIFPLFLLSLLGIFFSFMTYRSSIKEIETEQFKRSLREQTQVKLENTRHYISNMAYDLDSVSRMIAEHDTLCRPEVVHVLASASELTVFTYTAVVDETGLGFDQDGIPIDISDEDYFYTSMDGSFAFSEVQSLPDDPDTCVQIVTCPIWSEDNEVIGVTLGALNLDDLNQALNPGGGAENASLYIVDSNGNYISRFQTDSSSTQYVNFWDDLAEVDYPVDELRQMQSDFSSKKVGEFSFTDHGEQRYGCYMPIGTRNWQIVYTAKDTVVDQTVSQIFRLDVKHNILLVTCLLIALYCVIFYFNQSNNQIQVAHQEVSRNIQLLRIALRHSKQPVFEYDPSERVLIQKTDFQSPMLWQLGTRIPPERFIKQGVIPPECASDFLRLFEDIKSQSGVSMDVQINTGFEQRWCRISLHNIYKHDKIVSTVGFVEDISALKQMSHQVDQKSELLNTLISQALLYAKIDTNTQYVSELNGTESTLSYADFLQSHLIESVVAEDQSQAAQELSLDCLCQQFHEDVDTVETQFRMEHDGATKWVSCMAYCNPTNPNLLILLLNDIDEKKRQELNLQHQAERDGLTGLYNAMTARRKITEALESGQQTGEKQLFVLFDFDNYKLINDTFGHSFGDSVLLDVATILNTNFRSDDIAGRIGGDEFVLLMRNIHDYHNAESRIQDLCDRIHKTYTEGAKEVTLSASIGITKVPVDGTTFTKLFLKADKALYRVKGMSKNAYKYYEPSDED